MPTPSRTLKQINAILVYLVKTGLASDQNLPLVRNGPGKVSEVTFKNANGVSIALKNLSYGEIYDELAKNRVFSVKLPDGALVQMMYLFKGQGLRQHRLAFFPSPYLEEFQKSPEIYLQDEVFADIVARNIVSFPIRFDFDHGRTHREGEANHPHSHLTLGQYQNCRIPVSAPLSPFRFVDFILRNFYHTAHIKYANQLPASDWIFDECILDSDCELMHMRVPTKC
jgi:hypothetical protein